MIVPTGCVYPVHLLGVLFKLTVLHDSLFERYYTYALQSVVGLLTVDVVHRMVQEVTHQYPIHNHSTKQHQH